MIAYDLSKIKMIVFDVDGVLSASTVAYKMDGTLQRTTHMKDIYAIQHALRSGLEIAVLSGARDAYVRPLFESLGLKHVYVHAQYKKTCLEDLMQKTAYRPEEIAYMGDDMPDYEVMQMVGLGCCPADAAGDIRAIARYFSPFAGGVGCARDLIEQVMKAQGTWMNQETFIW